MPYADPEKRREYGREWMKRNPDKARAACADGASDIRTLTPRSLGPFTRVIRSDSRRGPTRARTDRRCVVRCTSVAGHARWEQGRLSLQLSGPHSSRRTETAAHTTERQARFMRITVCRWPEAA